MHCRNGFSTFQDFIHEFLNKDPDIVPEEDPLLIFYSNSEDCMAKNGKDTNHTRHIASRVHFLRNGEKCKIHQIDWCVGFLKLSDISTKNVEENDLIPRMKYIMVRLDK